MRQLTFYIQLFAPAILICLLKHYCQHCSVSRRSGKSTFELDVRCIVDYYGDHLIKIQVQVLIYTTKTKTTNLTKTKQQGIINVHFSTNTYYNNDVH